jgi:uncharacterized protein
MTIIEVHGFAAGWQWLAEPEFAAEGESLTIRTRGDTDFWQQTHYGFRRDNGHCLLRPVDSDFSLSALTEFVGKTRYDQCGLMLRSGPENWIKASIEYETDAYSRLGSVVTNFGYSDWASVELPGEVRSMRHRVRSKNGLTDFLIECSEDGSRWRQLRIAHMHRGGPGLLVGIYACSPTQGGFEARFSELRLEASDW